MSVSSDRLAISVRAIATAEGIAPRTLLAPAGMTPATELDGVAAMARRLQDALGGPDALVQAATNTFTWPTLLAFAPRASHVRELALAAWEALLVPPGAELRLSQGRRHPDPAVLTLLAVGPTPHTLRDGLDAVLVGAIRSAPLFFELCPAHVEHAYVGDCLTLEVTLPPCEGGRTEPVSSHTRPRSRAAMSSFPPGQNASISDMWRLELDAPSPPSSTRRVGATQMLAEGFGISGSSADVARLAERVFVKHLGFSIVRFWGGRSVRHQRLLAATSPLAGPGPTTTSVLELRFRGGVVGQLELDRQGDLEFARTLAPWLATELGSRLARERRAQPRGAADSPATSWGLTPRQAAAVALVAEGLANKEIADRLGCTCATVEEHLTAVYRKAGVRGRGELLAALHSGSARSHAS